MPGSKAQIDLSNTTLTKPLKDGSSKLKEGEAIIYDAIDGNNNLGYLEPNVQNIKDIVEGDDYDDDGYDTLLLAKLLLPNKSADGYIRGTVIKQAKIISGSLYIGTRHIDANLNTKRYIVKMFDGTK